MGALDNLTLEVGQRSFDHRVLAVYAFAKYLQKDNAMNAGGSLVVDCPLL